MWISFCPFLPDPSELETCIDISHKYLRRRIILFLLGFFSTVASGLTSGESICLRFWNCAIAPWSAYVLSPSGKKQPFKHVAWALALPLCLCLSLSLSVSHSSTSFSFKSKVCVGVSQSLNWYVLIFSVPSPVTRTGDVWVSRTIMIVIFKKLTD